MTDTLEKPNATATGPRDGAHGMDLVPLPEDVYSPSTIYDKMERTAFGTGFIGVAGRRELSDAAVPPEVIQSGLLSEARATFHLRRRWDFSLGGGIPVLSVAVQNAFGEEIDVIAWPIGRPDKWARLTGRAVLLGESDLNAPSMGEPVPVWRTPLSWLTAGCRGIVILDPAYAWRRLVSGPPLSGEDLEHAREIRAALTLPEPSKVFVRRKASSRKAAA